MEGTWTWEVSSGDEQKWMGPSYIEEAQTADVLMGWAWEVREREESRCLVNVDGA